MPKTLQAAGYLLLRSFWETPANEPDPTDGSQLHPLPPVLSPQTMPPWCPRNWAKALHESRGALGIGAGDGKTKVFRLLVATKKVVDIPRFLATHLGFWPGNTRF